MTPNRPLKIIVATQQDYFFTPRNVALLCEQPWIDVQEIILLDSRGSLVNKPGDFFRWFGVLANAKVALRVFAALFIGSLQSLGLARGRPRTLKAVARRFGIPLISERSINASSVVQRLARYDLDCIVSFSAPQVFKDDILKLPRFGCINLHCSQLPRYRGLLPSFWVLYHGEEQGGVTVHMMDEAIDNGAVLRQATVDIRGLRTMIDVMRATKLRGGELMLDALRSLKENGRLTPMEVSGEVSYYTWPTPAEARSFRKKGLRLA